jgi:hypothetical protein
MLFNKKLPIEEAKDGIAYINHVSRLEQKDIERCFARLFMTEDGKKVLAWLQVMTFQKVQGAGTSDEQLRYAEGQRSLMATILRLIDRGRTQ